MTAPAPVESGIERLRIRNYRVLRDVTFDGLTPFAVFLGANGSGKSTVFDALGMLRQAVTESLVAAWDQRGGLAEIRSRGTDGPVEVELGCRIGGDRFDYSLAVDEDDDGPFAARERLDWQAADDAETVSLLDFRRGSGIFRTSDGYWDQTSLVGPDVLAVETFGKVARNPQVASFCQFLVQLRLSNLDVERIRAGVRVRQGRRVPTLSANGDNLAQVVGWLRGVAGGSAWSEVLRSLRRYVPGLEDVIPESAGDGRQIVLLKSRGVEQPILPENISDGTLRLLGYLVSLRGTSSVLMIEEPENNVHPRLQYLLAEDVRLSAASGQTLVATHSPRFVDATRPSEAWAFSRGDDGFARVHRAADLPRLVSLVESGAALGDLWETGYFRVGDPLAEGP